MNKSAKNHKNSKSEKSPKREKRKNGIAQKILRALKFTLKIKLFFIKPE